MGIIRLLAVLIGTILIVTLTLCGIGLILIAGAIAGASGMILYVLYVAYLLGQSFIGYVKSTVDGILKEDKK